MNDSIIKLILSNGGIFAISRGNYGDKLLRAVEAIYRAGIRSVEVTFEQDKEVHITADAIRSLSDEFSRRTDPMAVGAGTVLTIEQLHAAANAGAQFIVSPNTDTEIIAETKKLGLISIPGAMTPTEIISAAKAGADIVKLFPAGSLGPGYFHAVATPIKHVRLAAVGGITVANLPDFRRAGACAFGISSSIMNNDMILREDYSGIELNARAFVDAAMSTLNG